MRTLILVATFVAFATAAHAGSNGDAHRYVVEAAQKYRVSMNFALRIAQIESGTKCSAIGAHGEVGPLQILPSTARSIGYNNIRSASCQVKTEAGMKYLSICYHKAGGDWRKAAACHNAGEAALGWKNYPQRVHKYLRLVMAH
jgi:soluble lytic murein transglycosylase-like protein